MTRIVTVTTDPACRVCGGEGVVYDSVDYGSTTAQLPSECECVRPVNDADWDAFNSGDCEIVFATPRMTWNSDRLGAVAFAATLKETGP